MKTYQVTMYAEDIADFGDRNEFHNQLVILAVGEEGFANGAEFVEFSADSVNERGEIVFNVVLEVKENPDD